MEHNYWYLKRKSTNWKELKLWKNTKSIIGVYFKENIIAYVLSENISCFYIRSLQGKTFTKAILRHIEKLYMAIQKN